jgi:hypothetical protein
VGKTKLSTGSTHDLTPAVTPPDPAGRPAPPADAHPGHRSARPDPVVRPEHPRCPPTRGSGRREPWSRRGRPVGHCAHRVHQDLGEPRRLRGRSTTPHPRRGSSGSQRLASSPGGTTTCTRASISAAGATSAHLMQLASNEAGGGSTGPAGGTSRSARSARSLGPVRRGPRPGQPPRRHRLTHPFADRAERADTGQDRRHCSAGALPAAQARPDYNNGTDRGSPRAIRTTPRPGAPDDLGGAGELQPDCHRGPCPGRAGEVGRVEAVAETLELREHEPVAGTARTGGEPVRRLARSLVGGRC